MLVLLVKIVKAKLSNYFKNKTDAQKKVDDGWKRRFGNEERNENDTNEQK